MQLNRRDFAKVSALAPFAPGPGNWRNPQGSGGLTDVPGIRVGHFTDPRRPTGCTVVLTDSAATAGVDVRGSAPGTRETDLLHPTNSVSQVDAILLAGGSAFGLDAAAGVVRFLEENGRGFQTDFARVPIVPAAILFDLGVGNPSIRPDAEAGYRACRNASSGPVPEGSVGAGAGATVGKMLGMARSMKGGVGTAAIRIGDVVVAALAAVNCIGDVRDPESGAILAGVRKLQGGFEDLRSVIRSSNLSLPSRPAENTTLVVVATNASFSKTELTKIAQMSHDGFARAIEPVHLPFDGDTAFALSLGNRQDLSLSQVGALAADVTAQAIARGVMMARGLPGIPSCAELTSGT